MVTSARFAKRISNTQAVSRVEGFVNGKPAVIESIGTHHLGILQNMLWSMEQSHLAFFQPHGFDPRSLGTVLGSRAYMTYGLFTDSQLVAYALLKISPTGAAFAGSLVRLEYTGKGIGKFLSRYLYWQAASAGFSVRATISKKNIASLRAYRAGRNSRIMTELANGWLLIQFPVMPEDATPPVLDCS